MKQLLAFRHKTICVLLLALAACRNDQPSIPQGDSERALTHGQDVIERCKQMSYEGFCSYVESLGRQCDFDGLAAIYRSDLPGHSLAAGEAAKWVGSKRAVEFCQQFGIGSPNWCASFQSLVYYPKSDVIQYIVDNDKCGAPLVRYYCYHICMARDWDDLLEEATLDAVCQDPVGYVPNLDADESTIGQVAQRYIDACNSRLGSSKHQR
jgi:hypothetical protein